MSRRTKKANSAAEDLPQNEQTSTKIVGGQISDESAEAKRRAGRVVRHSPAKDPAMHQTLVRALEERLAAAEPRWAAARAAIPGE